MRITLLLLFFLHSVTGCGPKNRDFNPFDDEFHFHKRFDISEYDTIRIECGYWNLTNRSSGAYYQFFEDQPEIVGKGFRVYVDVAEVDTTKDLPSKEFGEMVDKDPINLDQLKTRVSSLGIKDVKYVRHFTKLYEGGTGQERMDSVTSLALIYKNDSIYYPTIKPYVDINKKVWKIDYYKGKPH